MGKARILVAEDAEVIRLIMAKLLTDWNYDFTITRNGLEALEKLDSENFDLILMDIEMPVMDGVTAVKKIRKHTDINTRKTPIIAISYALTVENYGSIKDIGLNDYMSKPINPSLLRTKIEDCLKKP